MNTNTRFALFCAVLAGLCLLTAGLIAGGGSSVHAQDATVQPDLTATYGAGVLTLTPAPTPPATATLTATLVPVPGCWTAPGSTLSSSHGAMLKGVAGSAANDVWVVGIDTDGEHPIAFASHWDGQQWTNSAMPDFGGKMSRLYGVAGVAADDVWAVGSVGDSLHKPQHTLILHWDGQKWSQVPSPNLTENINELLAVAGVSSSDVWAAGYFEPNDAYVGGKQALLLHWDGTRWSQVSIPDIPPTSPGKGYSTLESISVLSKSDIWIAGAGAYGFMPLTLHWDGVQWRTIATPNVTGLLHGVSALAPDDVWAVGNRYPDQWSSDPLTMHWDGKTWSVVPSPSDAGAYRPFYWLNAVAALRSDDVWAVGVLENYRGPMQLIIYHWDGSAWSMVQDPTNPSYPNSTLYGAANIAGDLWTVGIDYHNAMPGSQVSLVLRHTSAPCGGPEPTPTQAEPLNPPAPLPGSGSRTFPETGKTLNGIFLDYWNAHGGLAQQGYPISDLMGEVSDLNGKLYTVQYTERAVFEYHPEYQAPYNVLLSQLGTFEYRKRYPQGAPNQQPNTDPGSVLFKETGHRLGGRFLDYWQTHGGLMQQGYPISDEFTEVSALNGQTYRVQYFEREVFEYHPENQPPYDVLLSQLGRFRYDAKYNTNAGNITALPGADLVAGHYTFWQTGRAETSTINGYDLQQKRQFVVSQSPTNKDYVASDGKRVVWAQDCPPYCQRLRGYDLQTGQEFSILEPSGRQFWKLFLDGDTLYFEEQDKERTGLYSRNLVTGEEQEIARGSFTADQMFQPVIENGYLLYSQVNGNNSQWTLHARKLDGSIGDRPVATSAVGFITYHAEGNYIIWAPYPEQPGENLAINVYRVDAGRSAQISKGPGYRASIRAGIVVWTELDYDQPSSAGVPHGPIVAYDLHTGKQWTVVPDRGSYIEVLGITDDNQVVFREQLPFQGMLEVYTVPLYGAQAATPTPSPTVTPAGPHGDLYLFELGR